MSLISILFVLSGLSVAQAAANQCDERAAYIQSRIESKRDLNAGLRSLKAKNWQVLALGEGHLGMTQKHIAGLFRKISDANPTADCLYMEFPETLQDDLDHIARGYSASSAFQNYFMYKPLIQAASELGFKVIAADSRKASPNVENTSSMLNERDLYMARVIEESLKSKRCQKGIVLVGKDHLLTNFREYRVNLAQRLKAQNVSVLPVNLQETGYNHHAKLDSSWNWRRCGAEKNPTIVEDEMFTFENENSNVPFFTDSGTWSDFFLTIMMPGTFEIQ